MNKQSVELDPDIIPSPARLVESLRDTGYSFVTSVADVVDNSIAANATKVYIDLIPEFDGNLKLYIADNGDGMSEPDVLNAMKYGSKKRVNPKSLGKFGMGLKTASTAFCRSLTVCSRQEGSITTMQWDIDVIIEEDNWKLLTPELSSDELEYLDAAGNGNGTLIIWDKIDRLVRTVDGSPDRKQIDNFKESLIEHLSGVFGRFISDKENPVEIRVNGELVEEWDPFCEWLGELKVFNTPMEVTQGEQKLGSFDFKVYILPPKNQMTKEQEKKARYGLDNQGFHIFREDRLIYSGGWLNRMFVKEPHFNLIRVEVSFDHSLDDFFQIDIKKSSINFPHIIREKIKTELVPLRREAERRYRGARKKGEGVSGDIHDSSNKAINKKMKDNVDSEVSDINKEDGTATVRNSFGETKKVKIPIHDATDLVVDAVETLNYGALWGPAMNGEKHSVLLNQSHDFYRRFYLSGKQNSVMVQAMDSVFWALAESELCTINDKAKRNLEEFRFKVSRILEDLASELPELKEEENIEDNEE